MKRCASIQRGRRQAGRSVTGWVVLLAGLVVSGCAGTGGAMTDAPQATDPLLGMLDKGIFQITANLDRSTRWMGELQRIPQTSDPIMRELRALDLSAWELHRQQWQLQRDHLRFAKEHLLRARAHPDEKSQLLTQWAQHEQAYEKALEDLRQQRHALERQRFQVEARLVERSLQ